nr:hypothetical protein Iba_chr08bCG9380 [Ipomoea batatas]
MHTRAKGTQGLIPLNQEITKTIRRTRKNIPVQEEIGDMASTSAINQEEMNGRPTPRPTPPPIQIRPQERFETFRELQVSHKPMQFEEEGNNVQGQPEHQEGRNSLMPKEITR